MAVDVLLGVLLLLSGTLAGVLFTVEMAIVPAVAALPGDRYVQMHRLLDGRFDPLMPRLNKLSLVVWLLVLILADGVWPRVAVGAAGLCTIAVAVVSEGWNVRINRVIDSWDPEIPPADWTGVRGSWAAANRIRTGFAVVGFAACILGTALTWR